MPETPQMRSVIPLMRPARLRLHVYSNLLESFKMQVLIQWVRVGGESLQFYHAPRWCQCCRSGNNRTWLSHPMDYKVILHRQIWFHTISHRVGSLFLEVKKLHLMGLDVFHTPTDPKFISPFWMSPLSSRFVNTTVCLISPHECPTHLKLICQKLNSGSTPPPKLKQLINQATKTNQNKRTPVLPPAFPNPVEGDSILSNLQVWETRYHPDSSPPHRHPICHQMFLAFHHFPWYHSGQAISIPCMDCCKSLLSSLPASALALCSASDVPTTGVS